MECVVFGIHVFLRVFVLVFGPVQNDVERFVWRVHHHSSFLLLLAIIHMVDKLLCKRVDEFFLVHSANIKLKVLVVFLWFDLNLGRLLAGRLED